MFATANKGRRGLNNPKMKIAARAWLQLLRAPNLLTVPGDPIAGVFLATGGDARLLPILFSAAAASLCFYSAGLLINDRADLAEDRAQRPGRPIPSGAVKPGTVLAVAAALLAVGEAICLLRGGRAAVMGLLLMAAVLSYNLALKKIRVLGPLSMGLCRGLSLLLGAAMTSTPDGFSAQGVSVAIILTLYIAAVTQLARHETESRRIGVSRWFPAGILLIGLAWISLMASPATTWERYFCAMVSALAWLTAVRAGFRLRQNPANVPPVIGSLIGALLLLQAAFIAGAATTRAGLAAGMLLLVLWPLNRFLARRFAAS